MKFLPKLLIIALLWGTPGLIAQDCNPCYMNSCGFDFSVYGEFLYWDICITKDEEMFSLTNPETTLNYSNDYQPGYRLGALAQMGCWFLEGRYTSLDSTKTNRSVIDAALASELVNEEKMDYSVADIRVGREIAFSRLCASITPYIGVKLAWIDETATKQAKPDTPTVQGLKYKNNFDGYGVEIGSGLRLKLLDCCVTTRFVADFSCALLKGTFESDVISLEVPPEELPRYGNMCALVFVPEVYVGLNFTLLDCNCFNADLSIGYEAQFWTQYAFVNNLASTVGVRESGSFSVDGLVVRLAVGF